MMYLVLCPGELVDGVQVVAASLGVVPHLLADLAGVAAPEVPGHEFHPLHLDNKTTIQQGVLLVDD
jgi:hypothetical protein